VWQALVVVLRVCGFDKPIHFVYFWIMRVFPMESNLKLFELGKSGVDYVRDFLNDGSGYCETLTKLQIEEGKVYSPLPANLQMEKALNFNIGYLKSPVSIINEWLVSHILEMAAQYPNSMLILQDFLLKESDMGWNGRAECEYYSEGKVYYIVPAIIMSREKILEAIHARGSSYLFGVFAERGFPKSEIEQWYQIPAFSVHSAAKTTCEIFVSAYDDEGVVMWRDAEFDRLRPL
jgi:hypothetical protein